MKPRWPRWLRPRWLRVPKHERFGNLACIIGGAVIVLMALAGVIAALIR